jgi:outer membrane lipoprotein-sorting protein
VRPLLLRLLAAAAVVSGAGGAVLLPASGTSGIGAAARQVLEMALAAPRLIDYEGTKVITVLRNGRTETVTVAESHKRPDMMRLEYLSPEGVAGRIIVDNGRVAWHYEPRLNMAFKDDTLQRGLLGRDLTLLFRNYRVSVLGTDEVIGRQAYVIALDPKGPGVRRELWVDRATGTVLRSEERDPGRGVVLSSYFSRISFSLNLPEAYFRYRVPAGARVFTLRGTEDQSLSPAALARRVRFPVLIPPVLPEGYTFRGGGISRFGSLTSVYLRYSDGDNAISFFEAPAGSIGWPAFGNPVRVNGQPGRYIDLGYFRVLIWEQEGLRLTAVGTAPSETLLTVASQIAAGQEDGLVAEIASRTGGDPATIRHLRGEGMTFPEIVRTLVLSRHLGTDLPTAVRFVRGSLTVADLARELRMRPEVLKQVVQEASARAARMTPLVSPALAPSGAPR